MVPVLRIAIIWFFKACIYNFSFYPLHSLFFITKDSGNGQLSFQFTNLRKDLAFYFFKDVKMVNEILDFKKGEKYSSVVKFVDYNQQLRPRIVPSGSYIKTNFRIYY